MKEFVPTSDKMKKDLSSDDIPGQSHRIPGADQARVVYNTTCAECNSRGIELIEEYETDYGDQFGVRQCTSCDHRVTIKTR